MEKFQIKGEFITLQDLLKATDLVSSGGMAKAVIQQGEVAVNEDVVTQRGKKLRAGDIVTYDDRKILISGE